MRISILFLIFSLFATPAFAQDVPEGAEPDSVTVSVESLRNLKHEFKILERQVELQDSIIAEQDYQINLYEKRADQDSLINDLTEQQLEIRDERIKMRDERIQRLERQKTWEQLKKYIWAGGSLVIGFLLGSAQ